MRLGFFWYYYFFPDEKLLKEEIGVENMRQQTQLLIKRSYELCTEL